MKKGLSACVITLLMYCFLTGSAFSQNYLPSGVKSALRSANLSNEQLSASITPLDGGKLSLNWRDRVKVLPASTEKMVTTLAALELLGPDWRWKTSYLYSGEIDGGILFGTLFVRGGGDPKYVAENLWRDLSRLKSMGIDRIEGNVVIDRTYFEKESQDPEFKEDWDRPYTAPSDAALLNYRSVALTLTPQLEQKRALVTSVPQIKDLVIPASIPIGKQKGCVRWRKALELNIEEPWKPEFGGALPNGCDEKILAYLIPDANQYWKVYFQAIASEVGLTWNGHVVDGQVSDDAVLLFDVWSDDLGSLVKLTNKFSNNVFAKHILLTLAAKNSPGIPASYSYARAVLSDWLQHTVKIAPGEIVLDNGSGLSRKSRVTARAMTKLITYAWKSPRMPEWISSFPISAVDGTMSKRLVAPGHAYIKTGLLNNVKSAGGLIQAKSGKRYAFYAVVQGKNATRTDAPIDHLIEWVYFNG